MWCSVCATAKAWCGCGGAAHTTYFPRLRWSVCVRVLLLFCVGGAVAVTASVWTQMSKMFAGGFSCLTQRVDSEQELVTGGIDGAIMLWDCDVADSPVAVRTATSPFAHPPSLKHRLAGARGRVSVWWVSWRHESPSRSPSLSTHGTRTCMGWKGGAAALRAALMLCRPVRASVKGSPEGAVAALCGSGVCRLSSRRAEPV